MPQEIKILKNIADFMKANTGTLFDDVLHHVTVVERSGERVPVNWDCDNSREGRPVLEDYRRNFMYMRQNGVIEAREEYDDMSCNAVQVANIPVRAVVHILKKDNGEHSNDILSTVWQFLKLWDYSVPSGGIVSRVSLVVNQGITDAKRVLSEESTAKIKLRQESEVVAIDFTLSIRFTASTCIESDLCMGDIRTLNRITTEELSVASFACEGCVKTVTLAAATSLIAAGSIIADCLYHITDVDLGGGESGIYLRGLTSSLLAHEGYTVQGGEVYAIKYDFAADEIVERRCKRGNRYTVTSVFIATFGNTISSFPWGDDQYQGNTIEDGQLTYVGFSGKLVNCRISEFSTLDISGHSWEVVTCNISQGSAVTFSGSGQIIDQVISASSVSIAGPASANSFINSTITSTTSGAINRCSAVSNSTITLSGSCILSSVGVSDGTIVMSSSGTMQSSSVAFASINLSDNTGLVQSFDVQGSTVRIRNNGAILSNFYISGADVDIPDNVTAYTTVSIVNREVSAQSGVPILPSSNLRIEEFESNAYQDIEISALNVAQFIEDYTGIVNLGTSGSATVATINKRSTFPERGLIRVQPLSASAVTIQRDVPATVSVGSGRILSEKNETLQYHQAEVKDFVELRNINGVWFLENVKNYV